MRKLILGLLLLSSSYTALAQSIVPSVTKINHAWVDGVYWNPEQYPGWGFFVDVQEELIFGAIYGYQGSDSTFITFQGRVSVADPLEFRGDVYFVTNGGNTISDVGNFTWSVRTFEASPGAYLTITSNILNASNLRLRRFSYTEDDKIDMLTAGDWNITTRVLGVSFGYHYGIYDDSIVEDGIRYALVINNTQTDEIGVAGYYPPGDGDAYGLLIEFNGNTNMFAVFNASDTEMYGRYWLLDPGESPSGNGNYFHASADTMQASHQELGVLSGAQTESSQYPDSAALAEKKNLHHSLYELSEMESSPMFSSSVVKDIHRGLKKVFSKRSLE